MLSNGPLHVGFGPMHAFQFPGPHGPETVKTQHNNNNNLFQKSLNLITIIEAEQREKLASITRTRRPRSRRSLKTLRRSCLPPNRTERRRFRRDWTSLRRRTRARAPRPTLPPLPARRAIAYTDFRDAP
ncbi:hypothetical protein JYU34_000073 [Plutella xylostella]|uniref:Uncharacterized protein n=1 Tax=Plutella xylostella TaxID=51655 RepID=A0ABQ7R6S4_PLUXY|nr:hypothetical protein JYU34_000073 [Plutella xylostella]